MPRFRPTFPGLIFLGITIFVLIATINTQINYLFFALGLMIGVFVVSALLASLSLRNLDIKRLFPTPPIAGQLADFQYLITNQKAFWPSFALHISEANPSPIFTQPPKSYALHLSPRQTLALAAPYIASTRGIIPLTGIRVACAFPFGFLNRIILIHRPEQMVVYPRIGALSNRLALRTRDSVETGTMTSNRRGGHDEFYGLREYRPGDNIRNIHWRSTARTGLLMTRELASNAPPQLIVVLNLRSAGGLPDHAPKVEHAIELAAALLCYGFLENFAVGLAIAGLPGAQNPPAPKMGRESRSQLLHQLAILNPAKILPTLAFPLPNRLVGRAEWIIVSLQHTDPYRDLLPSLAGSANHTVLALDHPDAETWLHFLSPTDSHRILRTT